MDEGYAPGPRFYGQKEMSSLWSRTSLAGQLLLLQLATVLLVLVAVAAASLAQSAESFRRSESRRALAVGEDVADHPLVRTALARPGQENTLKPEAESVRTVSGSSFVIIARPDRRILTSPDPTQLAQRLPLGDSDVLEGSAWTGTVTVAGHAYVVAHVPVFSEQRNLVGVVAVGREFPTIWQRLEDATPNLLVYLGVASALGVVGSLLVARRVKRQTLGLEPREITGLVEHREAMLHGIREGVLSLDLAQRVTLANDEARQLLQLPPDCVGRSLHELGVDRRLVAALTAPGAAQDELVLLDDRVLTLSRMPIDVRGRAIGSVSTLRDRTELVTLQRELGVSRHATDTLRAQAHEFSNQLHTISGLIQLGEYDEVERFVSRVSSARMTLTGEVTTRIADPALAALLIAKTSQAAERGLRLRLSPDTHLDPVSEDLSDDLTTVVGNLVDNALDAALDAVGMRRAGWVEVEVKGDTDGDADEVRVVVRDSGPGVAPEAREDVFEHGYTTKGHNDGNIRGLGLALTRLVCARRGGGITVHNEDGAVFTARLPVRSGGRVPT
jgi:sensor histidine kinase regulating citrate/malate metabolism